MQLELRKVVVKTVLGSYFGLGEFTTHFGGDWVHHPFWSLFLWFDWDVHWGYELDFDPWPAVQSAERILSMTLYSLSLLPRKLFAITLDQWHLLTAPCVCIKDGGFWT